MDAGISRASAVLSRSVNSSDPPGQSMTPSIGPGQSSGRTGAGSAMAAWATNARFRPTRRLPLARGVARYRRTTSRFGPHLIRLHRRPETR